MLRSMRRFSSSYDAITISMATNAEGTAEIGLSIPTSTGALREKKKTTSCSTDQATNETASKRSASVSCLRLSCQKTEATATNSSDDGTTTDTVLKRCAAFVNAHAPRTSAARPAANFHGLRCAYSCAPRKKNKAASTHSQRSSAVCIGADGTN